MWSLCVVCGVSIVASADGKRGAWQADATAMGRWGREPADRAAAEEALLALGGESGPFCIRRHKDKNKREKTQFASLLACMHSYMHTIMHSRGHGSGQSWWPTWCTPQRMKMLPVWNASPVFHCCVPVRFKMRLQLQDCEPRQQRLLFFLAFLFMCTE